MKLPRYVRICAILAASAAMPAGADVRTAWTRTYNGPTNHSDTDPAIVVAATGETYVAGASYNPGTATYTLVLIKYNPDGTTAWERFVPDAGSSGFPPGLLIDYDGNIVVTGSSGFPDVHVIVRKYSPAGVVLVDIEHPVVMGACSGGQRSPAVAVDGQNNIYLAWSVACDFWTAKFDGQGGFAWEMAFGTAPAVDVATDIAVDAAGNAVTVGLLNESLGGYGVVAYDTAGGVLWDDHESGPIGSTIGSIHVEVDPEGNFVVAANPETTCGLSQMRIWKYELDGTRAWTRSFPAEPCVWGEVNALRVDTAGNAVLAGASGSSSDYATVKYDALGNRVWTRTYNGAGDSTDVAFALALDELDQIYITGISWSSGADVDLVTVAYAADGAERWSRTIDLAGNDRGTGIAANRWGVHVAGYYFAGVGGDNFVVRKYFEDQAGDLNCDGVLSFADINAFVLALTDPAGYAAAFPQCNHANADTDEDGAVDFGDINPFVQLLVGG